MDLDALGLNSTFESTALEGSYEAPVDRVDTSEVEGPDDFTMNMTYWMTTDLAPAQIKSRKEAKGRDSRPATSGERQASEEGGHAAVETSTAASPTVRVNGTTASREYSTPASERSMENDEKVRSFLSALPDTDLDHLPTGTPLRVPRQSMLQVPRSSPPKARSLQATVEDCDTPRKPTQQTVIHHPSPTARDEHKTSDDSIAELQARLDQQELASRTRITELETILSYTRSELDTTRNDNYKHKEAIAGLERSLQEQRAKEVAVGGSTEDRLRAQEDAHKAKLLQLEQDLQRDLSQKLQAQREAFERQLRELEESKLAAREEAERRNRELENVQAVLAQLKQSNEQEILRIKDAHTVQEEESKQGFAAERSELELKLATVQTRAESLQADLARSTAEAKAAREASQGREVTDTATETAANEHLSRIVHLETHLRDTKFALECAQADVAAKAQLFQTNLNLNADLRALRRELETQRSAFIDLQSRNSSQSMSDSQLQPEFLSKDKHIAQLSDEKDTLERQLSTAQGRIHGLENSLTALRTQLTDAHREGGSVRADVERLAHDLEDANERLADLRLEADRRVADIEKKLAKTKDLKTEAENKFRELKSQHDDLVEGHAAMLESVRDKAEDAVRKTGALLAQERKEKARLKKDVERLQAEIEDLRLENEQKTALDEESDDTATPLPPASLISSKKDEEIESLRAIIKNQVAEIKTLKASHTSTITTLKATHDSTLTSLRSEIATLQSRLDTQATDHEAINRAMDEQLSHLLSKLMKERARTVVGKRDGQWEEVQKNAASEKELLGKVLMRQWGREECGSAEEKRGQKQLFEYKYVKRER
jgi:myosin protein heavy chain